MKTRGPTARQAPFANVADTYDFVFRDQNATKLDVIKPGFFNQHRGELIVGTMIECRLGHPCDGIAIVRVQIIHAPGYSRTEDVLVSYENPKTGKFTPVRHDGTMTDEQEKAA